MIKLKSVMIVDENGTKNWRYNGMFHREDGPAREWTDGSREWYQYGRLHRLDGPAVEQENSDEEIIKEWHQFGKLHRLDGPAVESRYGFKEFYIEGEAYSEEEYWTKIRSFFGDSNHITNRIQITIDGKKYKLTEES